MMTLLTFTPSGRGGHGRVATVAALWALFAAGSVLAEELAEELADFRKVTDDAWEMRLREDPLWATHVGDHRFDDRLPREGLADHARRADQHRTLLARLVAIEKSKLSASEQVNYEIFRRQLEHALGEYELQTHLMPISNRYGFHISFPDLPKRVPLATVQDYENYVARLQAFPQYTDDHIELMRAAIGAKLVLPEVVLDDYRDPIVSHMVSDPTKSLLFTPFTKYAKTIPIEQRERLTAAGKRAILESVTPAYRKFLEFMEREYVPAARESIGISAVPRGRELYRHRVRHFTTLDISPEEVHEIGLAEVKRIRAEMEAVRKQAGFQGGHAEFLAFLRTDAKFYANTSEELLKDVSAILKKIDGELPRLFGRLPRTPYGIREVPAYIAPQTSSAYYMLPAGDGSRAGFFYLNTYNLRARPLFEMEALSLHEGVPGHHLQLALQLEMSDVPNFRRHAQFTAFVEGWALYAERLGLEIGCYEDPYSNFGRLSFEMWRACRLVVDTGMHYQGWSREQAIQFMAENTALSQHNITAEVDRYISWPGQALAYKMGELKIRQLRSLAEHELGAKFDIRRFHDAMLAGGSLPLDVLEAQMIAFIAAEKRRTQERETE